MHKVQVVPVVRPPAALLPHLAPLLLASPACKLTEATPAQAHALAQADFVQSLACSHMAVVASTLRHVDLHGVMLAPAVVQHIAAAPWLQSVTELNLSDCCAAPAAEAESAAELFCTALQQRPPLTDLRSLSLSGMPLHADTSRLAAALSGASALTHIALSGCKISSYGAESLIMALASLPDLQCLDLRNNDIELHYRPPVEINPRSVVITPAQDLDKPLWALLYQAIDELTGLPPEFRPYSMCNCMARREGTAAEGSSPDSQQKQSSSAKQRGNAPRRKPPNWLLRTMFTHRTTRATAETFIGSLLLLRVAPRSLGLSGVPQLVVVPALVLLAAYMQLWRYLTQLHVRRPPAWQGQPGWETAVLALPFVAALVCVVAVMVHADPTWQDGSEEGVDAQHAARDRLFWSNLKWCGLGFTIAAAAMQHLSVAQMHPVRALRPSPLRTLVATFHGTQPYMHHGPLAALVPWTVMWLAFIEPHERWQREAHKASVHLLQDAKLARHVIWAMLLGCTVQILVFGLPLAFAIARTALNLALSALYAIPLSMLRAHDARCVAKMHARAAAVAGSHDTAELDRHLHIALRQQEAKASGQRRRSTQGLQPAADTAGADTKRQQSTATQCADSGCPAASNAHLQEQSASVQQPAPVRAGKRAAGCSIATKASPTLPNLLTINLDGNRLTDQGALQVMHMLNCAVPLHRDVRAKVARNRLAGTTTPGAAPQCSISAFVWDQRCWRVLHLVKQKGKPEQADISPMVVTPVWREQQGEGAGDGAAVMGAVRELVSLPPSMLKYFI